MKKIQLLTFLSLSLPANGISKLLNPRILTTAAAVAATTVQSQIAKAEKRPIDINTLSHDELNTLLSAHQKKYETQKSNRTINSLIASIWSTSSLLCLIRGNLLVIPCTFLAVCYIKEAVNANTLCINLSHQIQDLQK